MALPDDDMLGLVPVVIETVGSDGGSTPSDATDAIFAEIKDVRVLVPPCFEHAHLGRLIAAIRSAL